MLENYVKIALRSLRKRVGYTLLNLIGLAVGLACCMLILLFVRDELSYDRFHEDADRIHRIVLDGQLSDNVLHAPLAPAPMGAALAAEFPEVRAATRLFTFDPQQLVRRGDRRILEERVFFADSTFFAVFSFPFLQGDPRTALADPNTVVLTESVARKYFPEENPMGQTLEIGDETPHRVTGVIADLPTNTHMQFDMLVSMAGVQGADSPLWISNNFHTYLMLQDGRDAAALEAKIPAFFERRVGPQIQQTLGLSFDAFQEAGNRIAYTLQPLTDIHLRSHLEFEITPNSDIAYVYVFSVVALIILLIACINFMNLATARSATRAREVGMRKALGSTRGQLVRQFLSESLLLSGLALVVAVGLVAALLPAFNTLAAKSISPGALFDGWMAPGLLGLTIVVGLLAGSYPALYLSSFRPAAVLKGKLRHQGGARLRHVLVVFQFAVSIALIAGTVIVYNQLDYIRTKQLGFDKEHVVVVERATVLGDRQDAFKQELLRHPGVLDAAATDALPSTLTSQTGFQGEGSPDGATHLTATVDVDYDFADALGLEMAEGRFFSPDYPGDSLAVVINEAVARSLGWTDPVGRRVRVFLDGSPQDSPARTVIGVVRDFHFASLHQQITPMMLTVSDSPKFLLGVRVRPEDLTATLAHIEERWEALAPEQPFEYTFLDQEFDALYRSERRLGQIFTTFTGFAILIACLGLFGLASYTAEQRRKEIGVRKVLGATVPSIVLLLSGEFTRLVAIAFVLATPAAYLAMDRWLDDFAYRAPLPWWAFVGAGLAALGIAWLTVSYQSIKAAVADPVTSLRYE